MLFVPNFRYLLFKVSLTFYFMYVIAEDEIEISLDSNK